MFATWSDYKSPSFLARVLLQGGINWFPMAQSLFLVVLGFFKKLSCFKKETKSKEMYLVQMVSI